MQIRHTNKKMKTCKQEMQARPASKVCKQGLQARHVSKACKQIMQQNNE